MPTSGSSPTEPTSYAAPGCRIIRRNNLLISYRINPFRTLNKMLILTDHICGATIRIALPRYHR